MFKKCMFVFYLILYSNEALVRSSKCNEAVCASVVSKCMLTQSCKCDLTHCQCCKDCYNCLSYLYNDCCSCVDMCPGTESLTNTLLKESHTEKFIDGGVPALFALLTSEPDHLERWVSMSIPVEVSDISLQSVEEDISKQNSLATNCTVAYMSNCMPLQKCNSSCQSLGSSGFRWFHNGCCECVGETCKNDGLDENRCLHCQEKPGEEELSGDGQSYGEEIDLLEAEK